jgi:hypothetical protein
LDYSDFMKNNLDEIQRLKEYINNFNSWKK